MKAHHILDHLLYALLCSVLLVSCDPPSTAPQPVEERFTAYSTAQATHWLAGRGAFREAHITQTGSTWVVELKR